MTEASIEAQHLRSALNGSAAIANQHQRGIVCVQAQGSGIDEAIVRPRTVGRQDSRGLVDRLACIRPAATDPSRLSRNLALLLEQPRSLPIKGARRTLIDAPVYPTAMLEFLPGHRQHPHRLKATAKNTEVTQ